MPKKREADPSLPISEVVEKKHEELEQPEPDESAGELQGEQLEAAAEEDEQHSLEQAERIRAEMDAQEDNSAPLPRVMSLHELSETDRSSVDQAIQGLSRKKTSLAASLFTGNRTATEYDSKVANFSTKNAIVELSDGRKVFVISSRGSGTHRFFDGFMKRMTGCEMKKVSAKDWKEAFESKSDISVIENDDPDTVVLPFIPNVNAYDAFANRKEIKDFGECEYLQDAGEAELLQLTDSIIQKVQELHQKGIAWGEVILPNFIIDKEKKAHICDPEVRYNDRIALAEQKARDLLDVLHSVSAAMNQAENTEYQTTVGRMLDQYEDDEVLGELQRLAEKKLSIGERIFFGYTQVRLGQKNKKEFQKIRSAITEILEKRFSS